ncbi:PAS fold protein [Mariniflexile rhizosphaerae]|uniref:PAS domain S-box protein n=1 Tax=unclassified Mariniflexile TaxID=2643887 RepID=UPI000CC9E3E8|nr:PAS domain S-box protein [Mariniflexile sp. TRM1-10]AXP82799.1 PAS fold protein [Mariniflexile sp. TRM1-10]PLB19055.1 MAG: PAS sensor protein [Flavobacteriaceae bacterium FS1-H7996/R]
MSKKFGESYQREETDNLLRLIDNDKSLDSEGLGRLLEKQNINKLKLIAENTIDVICLHHPKDWRYLYASPSTEKIMGYTSENLKGRVPYDFIHPDHLSILAKNLSGSKKGVPSDPEKLELLFKTKDNGYQWFEGYTKPIYNNKNEIVLVLSCTRNIQDRKIAETEKKERESIQQNLLVSSILLEKKKAIIEKIEHKILELEPHMRKDLRSILTYIQETLNLDENWEDFMIHFKKIHPDFYNKVSITYPYLSKKDLKYLAFIKLGMTSTDIAKAMIVKKESLRVTRNRLKKKLGLDSSQDLVDFVKEF